MIVFDSDCFDAHHPADGHPERVERVIAAREALRGLGFDQREARPATSDELLAVHQPAYVERLLSTRGRRAVLDLDTLTSAGSIDAALRGAGGAIQAAEALIAGTPSFVLCRPPGHHATADQAMGFCLFNNAAVAAAWLAARGRRVAIIDPDVHHGNGTQAIFWGRREVLYVSLHRYPFYPGTGAAGEYGAGAGLGTTLNVPLAAGAGDGHYHAAMRQRVLPALNAFAPDAVILSAGYDALDGDDMGGMGLSVAGLAALWAEITRRWPTLAVLEGGYNLDTLAAGVRATARVLAGQEHPPMHAPDPQGWVSQMARWTHPLLLNRPDP